MEKYTRISFDERVKIARLRQEGYSIRKIASLIGRNPATVYRELQLHSVNGFYNPNYAQEQYLSAQKNKGRSSIIKSNMELVNDIRELLLSGKSPEQVCAILKEKDNVETVCVNTVYRAIKAGDIPDISMETIKPKSAKMFNNGCLTVPAHIREKLGLMDGDIFLIKITDDNDLIFRKICKTVEST